ncbi:MAG: AarF/UbiB family protein [Thermoanaerobacteraceae bacterium]|nr:AarF/UbiB family protein [Thermoanaerobacteraceae bacterium]
MEVILPGQRVKGLWSGSTYTVIRQLGQGGVGAAYLVSKDDRLYCLKVSDDMISLTWEYRFIKSKGKFFLPEVYEIDDFVLNNKSKHYIILEYIEGKNLSEVIKARPVDLNTAISIVLLVTEIFIEFFKMGYIYTDLKPENLMLDLKNSALRLIDLGSLVKIGGMVREYTPVYDRAFWNCGLRRADEGYAAFEIMMFTANLLTSIDSDILYKQDVEILLKRLSGCTSQGLYGLMERAFKGQADLSDIRDGLISIHRFQYIPYAGKIDFCINVSLIMSIIFLISVIIYGL